MIRMGRPLTVVVFQISLPRVTPVSDRAIMLRLVGRWLLILQLLLESGGDDFGGRVG